MVIQLSSCAVAQFGNKSKLSFLHQESRKARKTSTGGAKLRTRKSVPGGHRADEVLPGLLERELQADPDHRLPRPGHPERYSP